MTDTGERLALNQISLRRNHVAVAVGTVSMAVYAAVDYLLTPDLWPPFAIARAALAALGLSLMTASMLKQKGGQASLYGFWIPALLFAAFGAGRMPTEESLFLWNMHLSLMVLFAAGVAVSPLGFPLLLSLLAITSYLLIFVFHHLVSFRAMLINGGLFYLFCLAVLPLLIFARYRLFLQNARMQLKIASQNEELRRSNSAKDRFFSLVAHDLKGPLGSAARVLNRVIDGSSEQREEDLKLVGASVDRLYAHLENLMLWARNQRGELHVLPVELGVEGLLDKAWRETASAAAGKRIDWEKNIDPAHRVVTDKKMALIILHNLLNNAVKYTEPEGRIVAVSSRRGKMIQIEIRDTGAGMDAERLARLFKIEEKQSDAPADGERGSGLGLILSKEFAEKNGGSLCVTSVPGQGSSFFLELPSA